MGSTALCLIIAGVYYLADHEVAILPAIVLLAAGVAVEAQQTEKS